MLTPLMKQYWDIKSLHRDKIVFFRMGDFFELFHDDAITAAPILGIALTARNKKAEDETPMCGVPHFSVPQQINKLLRQGYKVAICDQVEDPKEAKGLVKRAVTRILSPGMVYDPDNLEIGRANYLAAFDEKHVAFLEASTGEAFFFALPFSEHLRLLELFRPVEIVISPAQHQVWTERAAQLPLQIHLSVWGEDGGGATARLTEYAVTMQGEDLRQTLGEFEERKLIKRLELGAQALRHLEVFENYRGESKGSLLSVIDKTKTSGGGRFLRYWLATPTCDRELLKSRHDQVAAWTADPQALKQLRERLRLLGDVERRVMKISNPSCNPRDLVSLALCLQVGCEVSQTISAHVQSFRSEIESGLRLAHEISSSVVEEPPVNPREARIFQRGFSADLDGLIRLTDDADSALLEMETREKSRTGIASLKIRYNNVFGYYIEITHAHRDRVPAEYQRKQTLVNAERFITPELLELERAILAARSKREKLEFEFFCEMKQKILRETRTLLKLAHVWSELDVVSSFAWLALERRYVRPQFREMSDAQAGLRIVGSRHPVVEQLVSVPFVSNDIYLKKGDCILLTGPNMAGKSTIMRQVALTVLLAQVGAFVPATEAQLPVFTGLLTRIGSSDALWDGLSTFMVEMTETAELLKNAGPETLVILDEIGRGTSTFDGMSLAQSILEELVQRVRATTFFATHYHELTELSTHFAQIHNAHMSLREQKGNLSFLYTLTEGASNRSYGIQVGKLAGLPTRVVARAQDILKEKERAAHTMEEHLRGPQMSLFDEAQMTPETAARADSAADEDMKNRTESAMKNATDMPLIREIAEWDMERLSPLDVFQKVLHLRERATILS